MVHILIFGMMPRLIDPSTPPTTSFSKLKKYIIINLGKQVEYITRDGLNPKWMNFKNQLTGAFLQGGRQKN